MIRKLALGLVAAATVGAAALAPTAASAFTVKVGVGPTWHPHHHHVYVAPPLFVGCAVGDAGCRAGLLREAPRPDQEGPALAHCERLRVLIGPIFIKSPGRASQSGFFGPLVFPL